MDLRPEEVHGVRGWGVLLTVAVLAAASGSGTISPAAVPVTAGHQLVADRGRVAVRPVPRPAAPDLADRGGGPVVGRFFCVASWYGPGFAGARTASGEPFNPDADTAASPWLPFGTRLLVTYLATGRSVEVTVNDRGPYGAGRELDLSQGAAQAIGLSGVGRVEVQILR